MAAGAEEEEAVVAADTVDANQIQVLEQVEDQEAIDVDFDDQGSQEEVLLDSLVVVVVEEAPENQVGHTDSMD